MDMTCFQNSIYRIASTRAMSSQEGKPFRSLQLITCIKGLISLERFFYKPPLFTTAIAAGMHITREMMLPQAEL